MEIQLIRDLVIIVAGTVVTVAAIIVVVVVISVNRKVKDVLQSTRAVARRIEALAVIVGDELGRPMMQAAGVIQSVAFGIREIGKIFRKGD